MHVKDTHNLQHQQHIFGMASGKIRRMQAQQKDKADDIHDLNPKYDHMNIKTFKMVGLSANRLGFQSIC